MNESRDHSHIYGGYILTMVLFHFAKRFTLKISSNIPNKQNTFLAHLVDFQFNVILISKRGTTYTLVIELIFISLLFLIGFGSFSLHIKGIHYLTWQYFFLIYHGGFCVNLNNTLSLLLLNSILSGNLLNANNSQKWLEKIVKFK